MYTPNYSTQPMDQLDVTNEEPPTGWIWNGYLARGNLKAFIEEGGLRERMTRGRLEERAKQQRRR